MRIVIGSDHRGFDLKSGLVAYLSELAYHVTDLGAATLAPEDDYVAYAAAVAREVSRDFAGVRGILICGSGVGVSIVANKFENIRAALALTPDQASAARNDDDANILALAADYTDLDAARRIVSVFLQTPFSREERHLRRIDAIRSLELNRSLH